MWLQTAVSTWMLQGRQNLSRVESTIASPKLAACTKRLGKEGPREPSPHSAIPHGNHACRQLCQGHPHDSSVPATCSSAPADLAQQPPRRLAFSTVVFYQTTSPSPRQWDLSQHTFPHHPCPQQEGQATRCLPTVSPTPPPLLVLATVTLESQQ